MSNRKLAQDLLDKMDSEGLHYYFFEYGADIKALEKLGFDRKKIEGAIKAAEYLSEVFDSLQDMVEEE